MQFITRTTAAGIAINAWFLLGFVETLLRHPELRREVPFVTRLISEQKAEKVFRAARMVLGGENFTLAEFLHRCDRLMALSMLRVLREADLVFPEHDSTFKWDETQRADHDAALLADNITIDSVRAAVMDARLACVSDMLALGVDVNKFIAVFHLDDGTLNELDTDDAAETDATKLMPPTSAELISLLGVRVLRAFRLTRSVAVSACGNCNDRACCTASICLRSCARACVRPRSRHSVSNRRTISRPFRRPTHPC